MYICGDDRRGIGRYGLSCCFDGRLALTKMELNIKVLYAQFYAIIDT